MRCKHCGAEIIRIHTMGGPAICRASPITYWPARDKEARELLTPNGSNVYGNLTGKPQDAVGVGYLPHSCHQMLLILQGRDSWRRPVYRDLTETCMSMLTLGRAGSRISAPSIKMTLSGNRMIVWRVLASSLRRAGISGKWRLRT